MFDTHGVYPFPRELIETAQAWTSSGCFQYTPFFVGIARRILPRARIVELEPVSR